MRRLAIIPARGGSKRLPRKNVVDFLGKPIIAHTIEAAFGCGLFDEVLVSTEDPEVDAVARRFGVRTSARPQALATDYAQVKDVCMHVLDDERKSGREYEVFCCLYATAPLRNAADIAATVRLLQPGSCDFSMAVTEYPYPPYQALTFGADNRLAPLWPELVNKRTQEVGRLVVDNGSTYGVTVKAFEQHGSFYGPSLRGHIMPFERSIDIDVAEDLELCRLLATRASR